MATTEDRARLTPEASAFITFAAEHSKPATHDEALPRVQTEELSSSIGRVYEQLRNTVDSTEHHLLRRNAIHRFLRRHVLVYGTQADLGELLIRELIRAGYVPNGSFLESDVERLDTTIRKYRQLIVELVRRTGEIDRSDRRDASWVLGLASAEVEQMIYPPVREEALIHFAFSELKRRIVWEDASVPTEDRDIQLYIALHRAIFKSDSLLIEYHLLSSYYQATDDDAVALAEHLIAFRGPVQAQLDHPYGARLTRRVRRMVIPFQALLDVVITHPEDALDRLRDEETFIKDVVAVVNRYYAQNRQATRRSTVRSIVFILITKVLVALALEVPYDLWAYGSIKYVPLAINATFHPLLLLTLGTSARFPDKANTKRIVADLWGTLQASRQAPKYYLRLVNRRSAATRTLLTIVYVITFGITLSALVWGLHEIGFGLVDGALFLSFVSLVTFVGIRLRLRAGEYFMVQRRETLLGSLFIFFASPLIEVGRWVSSKFRRYNLFLFFFDIILEAPFKTLTYVIEEWFRFARERSERTLD